MDEGARWGEPVLGAIRRCIWPDDVSVDDAGERRVGARAKIPRAWSVVGVPRRHSRDGRIARSRAICWRHPVRHLLAHHKGRARRQDSSRPVEAACRVDGACAQSLKLWAVRVGHLEVAVAHAFIWRCWRKARAADTSVVDEGARWGEPVLGAIRGCMWPDDVGVDDARKRRVSARAKVPRTWPLVGVRRCGRWSRWWCR